MTWLLIVQAVVRSGPDDGLRGASPGNSRLAERPERGTDLVAEELRLFPGGEVAAHADLVKVGEGGIGAPGPGLRGPEDVFREDRDGHRDGDLGGLHRGRAGGAGPAVLPVQ